MTRFRLFRRRSAKYKRELVNKVLDEAERQQEYWMNKWHDCVWHGAGIFSDEAEEAERQLSYWMNVWATCISGRNPRFSAASVKNRSLLDLGVSPDEVRKQGKKNVSKISRWRRTLQPIHSIGIATSLLSRQMEASLLSTRYIKGGNND